MKDARYPIGKYSPPENITNDHISEWVTQMKNLPGTIRQTIANLSKSQLKNTYRRGGWNIHELVYHLTDSHCNSYIRYKWSMTEDSPVIKAYDEKAANLAAQFVKNFEKYADKANEEILAAAPKVPANA